MSDNRQTEIIMVALLWICLGGFTFASAISFKFGAIAWGVMHAVFAVMCAGSLVANHRRREAEKRSDDWRRWFE